MIEAIDLRREGPPRGRFIAPRLAEAVQIALERGEQALLFLNRRGYAPLTLCRACGFRLQCPNCDAWLVDHRFKQAAGLPSLRLLDAAAGGMSEVPRHRQLRRRSAPASSGWSRRRPSCFRGARILVLSSDLVESIERLRAELDDVARRPLRHRHRHAARRQGPSFPQAQSGRHRRRRSRARQRRSARRRAHVPASASGGRPRRPRGGPRRRLSADASARASGDEGADLGRPRGVLFERDRAARAHAAIRRSAGSPAWSITGQRPARGGRLWPRAGRARRRRTSGARARPGRGADRGGARPPSLPPAGEIAARLRSVGLSARLARPRRPSRAAMCGSRSTSIR